MKEWGFCRKSGNFSVKYRSAQTVLFPATGAYACPKGAVDMSDTLMHLSGVLWGWGTIALVLGSGALLMVRTRFLPLRRLGAALAMART